MQRRGGKEKIKRGSFLFLCEGGEKKGEGGNARKEREIQIYYNLF